MVRGIVHTHELCCIDQVCTGTGRDGVVSRKKQRTGKRHAYIEKVWGAGEWKDVGEPLSSPLILYCALNDYDHLFGM